MAQVNEFYKLNRLLRLLDGNFWQTRNERTEIASFFNWLFWKFWDRCVRVCVCFLILLLPFETRRLKNFKNFKNCKVVCTEKKLIHLKMRWKWFIVEMNLRKNETNVKNAAFAHPIIYRLINKKCKRKVSRITNFKVVIFGNASRLNGYL